MNKEITKKLIDNNFRFDGKQFVKNGVFVALIDIQTQKLDDAEIQKLIDYANSQPSVEHVPNNKPAYNDKISKLAGLFTQVASEIQNDPELKQGEKFLLLQRLMADIAPATKAYDKMKKELETEAKQLIQCNGDKQSEPIELHGAEVVIKYSYPAPTLDSNKLEIELQRAYAEIGTEYNQNDFVKPTTVRQTVIIQSIL
jgi:hypothetical protein